MAEPVSQKKIEELRKKGWDIKVKKPARKVEKTPEPIQRNDELTKVVKEALDLQGRQYEVIITLMEKIDTKPEPVPVNVEVLPPVRKKIKLKVTPFRNTQGWIEHAIVEEL